MKFGDYSPPLLPSLKQQRDALQKGLGRAVQWALSNRLDDAPLLEACLRDLRFDAQVESSREDWLWQMVRAVGATKRFQGPIFDAINDLSNDRNASQLCQLAKFYAHAGEESFRTRLYEIVEQKPVADRLWLGEHEIVTLDGESAFLFAARIRGRLLADREWEWDDDNLINIAVESFGKDHTGDLLAASTEAGISRFRDRWLQNRSEQAEEKLHRSNEQSLRLNSVEEIFRAAEGDSKCFWFRGWGKHADDAKLNSVLERLWEEQNPNVIANLVKVFSVRALPEFDFRLVQLCRHADEEVRRGACGALEQNSHPLVREFALSELKKGVFDASVIALFINNYLPGDEHKILESIELPNDADNLHWLLMDVIKVLEKNTEADCSHLGVICYALTPCESCRNDAGRLILNQGSAPDWVTDECAYDSHEDTRAMVKQLTIETETEGSSESP